MAFPVSPTNGQTAVVNNITYQFSNVGNTWTRVLTTANVITANTIVSNGAISAVGNVSGNYFLGNGALLTGVVTSVSNISNGTSNVRVVSSGGNIAVGVGGTANVVVWATTGEYVTGLISASGNITGGNISTGGSISATGTLSVTGNTTLSTTSTGNLSSGNITTGGLISATGNITGGNINLSGNIVDTGALTIISGSNGNITLAPDGTGIVSVSAALSATGNVTTSGNINLSGTGARITGDFSNATLASRTLFQTSTANSFTAVMSIPSGSSNTSGFTAFSSSDPGNAGLIQMAMISASEARVTSANTGTGTYANLTFFTGGSQRFGIDTNGNVTANVLLSVTGNITGGNLLTGGLISATANVQAGNLRTAGLISATANITGGNMLTAGQISATGNITGNFFIGNGAFLTGLSAGSSSNIANGATNITIPVSSGNIAMSVAGQSNTVVINLGSLTMYGTFAGPKTLNANVSVASAVNALLLGPVSIGEAYNITVPDSSTLYVYTP